MTQKIKFLKKEIKKETNKLNWMKQQFIKECRMMLDKIEKQELKLQELSSNA